MLFRTIFLVRVRVADKRKKRVSVVALNKRVEERISEMLGLRRWNE